MSEVTTNDQYLGDGVYLSDDGYQLWLAVNNHQHKVVALDPSVIVNLIRLGVPRIFGEHASDVLKTIAQGMEKTDDQKHDG